ncbi:hypothetical protein BDV95DRAFT_589891 [Massariosphaeria phaeospora]|uniref:Uncharacterized protein n=1 Tax=Massariosphaeria phaeospora TaxID=100035 RepID=A0A7C8IHH0_9PLEO|nr:hypothetical protein BDV95DRAFT_589891 [Massariosphaeria phaeospora]
MAAPFRFFDLPNELQTQILSWCPTSTFALIKVSRRARNHFDTHKHTIIQCLARSPPPELRHKIRLIIALRQDYLLPMDNFELAMFGIVRQPAEGYGYEAEGYDTSLTVPDFAFTLPTQGQVVARPISPPVLRFLDDRFPAMRTLQLLHQIQMDCDRRCGGWNNVQLGQVTINRMFQQVKHAFVDSNFSLCNTMRISTAAKQPLPIFENLSNNEFQQVQAAYTASKQGNIMMFGVGEYRSVMRLVWKRCEMMNPARVNAVVQRVCDIRMTHPKHIHPV